MLLIAAMAELRSEFLKKRYRIAVAWRVKDGGAMADVAARRKMTEFVFFFVRGRS